MFGSVYQANTPEPSFRGRGRGIRVGSGDEERQVDVLARGQSREQAKGLEHHAELARPSARHLGGGQIGERPPVPPYDSTVGWFETCGYAEQGALSRARRAHDNHQLARRKLKRDVSKGNCPRSPVAIRAVNLLGS